MCYGIGWPETLITVVLVIAVVAVAAWVAKRVWQA